jgi:hypothetical protein
VVERGDGVPAGENYIVVVVRFDEADDGGRACGGGGGEEGAAALRAEEFLKLEAAGDGAAFVFVPEFHLSIPVLKGSRREPLPARVAEA